MKHLITVFFLSCVQFVFSQGSTCITYNHTLYPYSLVTINGSSDYLKDRFVNKARLYFNDSVSFYQIDIPNQKKKDLPKEGSTVGDKLKHHAVFYNRIEKKYYWEVAWPADTNYLVVYDVDTSLWYSIDKPKKILGYDCEAAYNVDVTGDTTTVWYTTKLNPTFGPGNFLGFPGMVLEVLSQHYNMHLLAEKIVPQNINVVMPKNVEIHTWEYEREKKMKSIKNK